MCTTINRLDRQKSPIRNKFHTLKHTYASCSCIISYVRYLFEENKIHVHLASKWLYAVRFFILTLTKRIKTTDCTNITISRDDTTAQNVMDSYMAVKYTQWWIR